MEIKLFSDLLDVLEKIIKGIVNLKNIPKNERARIQEILDETYRLLDTSLNMVIIRLEIFCC